MVYLLLLLYCFFCAVVYKKQKTELTKIHLALLFLFTVLLFGLRYRVGVDTMRYIDHYKEVKDIFSLSLRDFQETDFAPLFVLLFSICKTFGSFTFFQFVHAIVLNSILFLFIKKYSINPFLTIFFYFIAVGLYFNTEILRESLAVAVFLLNYKNVEKKRWLRYYLLSIISIGFHYSAIITLIVPLFSRLKFNRKVILFVALYIALVFLMMFYIQNSGIPIELLAYRYSSQIDFKETQTITIAYYIGVLIKGVIFPLIVMFCNRKYKIVDNSNFEAMVILFSIVSATCVAYPLIFDRFSNYFVFFFLVSIANCFSTVKFSRSIVGVTLFVLMSVFFIYFNVKKGTYERYFPYTSVFDQQRVMAREKMYMEEL